MIKSKTFLNFDACRVPSPCFVVDEVAVEQNLKILNKVQQATDAKILLALKAFSMYSLAPLICKYLKGTSASGLHEALLGYEEFNGAKTGSEKREVHAYSVAYTEKELLQILNFADSVVFNSFGQWNRFQALIKGAVKKRPAIHFGLRINPMHSEGTVPIYDPGVAESRLGIPPAVFQSQFTAIENPELISGLHFHNLCMQGFEPLSRTLDAVEERFSDVLPNMEWINFGGGHSISYSDYDLEGLIQRINAFKEKYQVQVYLEPGDAIAAHTGVLVSEVLDLTWNERDLAILDVSATCHMPDTLEMPYRPAIIALNGTLAGKENEKPHTYRFGGPSCLAGDIIGDYYSFDQALRIGDRLLFDDMAQYTMVKMTTFNGIALPAIAIWNSETDELKVIKEFSYADFKNRLS